MLSNGSDSRSQTPLNVLIHGGSRPLRDLFSQPVLRVVVKGRGDRDVICRVISTELDGRIPLENLAGGRFDARMERLQSLKVGTVVRVHFGFDADGMLLFDERKLYADKVFEEFPIGKAVCLPICRANQAIGVHLRYNFGDGRFHEVFIPRGHLRHSVSAYHVGKKLCAEVIVSKTEANGDLSIVLSERAQAWRRLSSLTEETTVRARYRGFKHGNHQFALFSLRGTLHPDELPEPLSAEQSTVGAWVNVRVKSLITGRLLLTRKNVRDDALVC